MSILGPVVILVFLAPNQIQWEEVLVAEETRLAKPHMIFFRISLVGRGLIDCCGIICLIIAKLLH
jgi:hypothetical protein